jgi:hypothetical protein
MKVILCGIGKIGRIHAMTLANAYNSSEVIFVDPAVESCSDGTFPSLEVVPEPIILRADLFLVCSPTAFHLNQVRWILKKKPNARVIVEKPSCLPGEASEFRSLQLHARQQGGFLMTQNAIAKSRIVRRFSSILEKKQLRGDRIQSVHIEFSKDRTSDQRQGRFIDNDWKAMGYEFFHMSSLILASIIPASFRRMNGDIRVILSELNELTCSGQFSADSGFDVQFHSSFDGHRKWNLPHWVRIRLGDRYRRNIEECHPQKSLEFRYRFCRVLWKSGDETVVVFEHLLGEDSDYKNVHGLFLKNKRSAHRIDIRENLIREGLLKQIDECLKSEDVDLISPWCLKLMESAINEFHLIGRPMLQSVSAGSVF